jgi:protein-S-isoprenylcysteine O-methyltransferase Ste14
VVPGGAPMIMLIRHALAIGLLPFTVGVLVPWWICRRNGIGFGLGDSLWAIALQALGIAAIGIGLTLFVASLRRFAVQGHGTLAPWDPPRDLVVHGVYRYVRNPMISGVVFVLFGGALLLLSPAHLAWAALFALINCIYIPLIEEPQLVRRFGDSYREYCRHVPRVLPRLTPWQPEASRRG